MCITTVSPPDGARQDACLDSDQMMAILRCTCSIEELERWLGHTDTCPKCTAAFGVIALLVSHRVWFVAGLAEAS